MYRLQAQGPFHLLDPPRDLKPGKESIPGAAGACRELGGGAPRWTTDRCWWCPAFLGWMLQLTALPPVHLRAKEPAPLRTQGLNCPLGSASTASGKARGECDRAAQAAASHAGTGYGRSSRSSSVQARDRARLSPRRARGTSQAPAGGEARRAEPEPAPSSCRGWMASKKQQQGKSRK